MPSGEDLSQEGRLPVDPPRDGRVLGDPLREGRVQDAPVLDGDDLLAVGVSRFLGASSYEIPPSGYARITRAIDVVPPHVVLPAKWLGASRRLRAGHEPDATLSFGTFAIVDIESLGFVGRPLFLIGVLHGNADPARADIVQYLARDYSEERAILTAFMADIQDAELWVTFNGRAFDLPFLRLRADLFRLPPPEPVAHLDLLPVARKLWRSDLPDCRQKTLEQRICGRLRGTDLSGPRIPEAYHDYVRTGEPWQMIEILRHNASDLVGLLELLGHALGSPLQVRRD